MDLISASLQVGSGLVRDAIWDKLALALTRTVRDEIIRNIRPEDEPGVLLIAHPEFVSGSSEALGVLLALEGRAILAWSTGVRPRTGARVVKFASAAEIVEVGRVAKTWREPEHIRFRIVDLPRLVVRVPNVGNTKGLVFGARAAIDGAMTVHPGT